VIIAIAIIAPIVPAIAPIAMVDKPEDVTCADAAEDEGDAEITWTGKKQRTH
jgi:hypothetical protein